MNSTDSVKIDVNPMDTWQKVLILPVIPIVLAYLELGGNWFGLRLIEKGINPWSLIGIIVFSVGYSLVSACIALHMKLDLGLLMVSYGFGFSIIAILLRLEWGKLPAFSTELIKTHPSLWIVGTIALLGFLVSSYILITSK